MRFMKDEAEESFQSLSLMNYAVYGPSMRNEEKQARRLERKGWQGDRQETLARGWSEKGW
jgi:hypothetical protein